MATVSFRVPDDLRRRMDELDVDWPEKVRVFLEDELVYQQRQKALLQARELRKRYAKAARTFSMSAEVLRSRREDH